MWEDALAVVVIEVAGVFIEVIVAVPVGGGRAAAGTALAVVVIEVIVAVPVGGGRAAAGTALAVVVIVEVGSH